jgi:sec-independent protein translocase protein TatC
MADTDAVRGAGLPDRLPAVQTPSSPGQPAAQPEKVMTLVDHLTELRTRIVRSIVAVVVGTAIGFLVAPQIKQILVGPLPASALPLQVLGPGDAFGIQLRISVVVGIILAMPVLLYQLWAFIAPGLHKNEKKYSLSFVAAAVPLFAAGTALCFFIFPQIMNVLLGFTPKEVANAIPLGDYIGFFLRMIMIFGVSFEIPLIVVALNFAGVLSAKRLKHTWRYVTFGIFVFAAAAVPTGEPLGMTALAAPMCALYYAAIGIAVMNDKRRAARNPYADLSPDEASDLDLTPRPIEPVAPIQPQRRDYDDLT